MYHSNRVCDIFIITTYLRRCPEDGLDRIQLRISRCSPSNRSATRRGYAGAATEVRVIHWPQSWQIRHSFGIRSGRRGLRSSRCSWLGHRIPRHRLRTVPGCSRECSGAAEDQIENRYSHRPAQSNPRQLHSHIDRLRAHRSWLGRRIRVRACRWSSGHPGCSSWRTGSVDVAD